MAQRFWQLGLVVIVLIGMLLAAQRRTADGGAILFPASTGDSVFVRTAAGTRILIDCGNDAPALLTLLGLQRPVLASGAADVLILTHHGSAWQGGCPALVGHGVATVWYLPAVADDAARLCHDGMRCLPFPAGDMRTLDGVQFRAVDSCSVRIDWAGGAVWVAHGCQQLGESGTWPARGVRIVALPWVIAPQAVLATIRPTHLIFRSGMRTNTPARLSFAQRRVGSSVLLHRDTDGTIRINLAAPVHVWREAQE